MNKKNNIVALFTAPQKIELVKQSMPIAQANYVLVEYLYCSICGGDYSVYCGHRKTYPISLGHEFVGRVIAVGEKVQDIIPGQYVVSDFNFRCNECIYCFSNQSHLCIKNDAGLFSNRGFATYASIHSSYLMSIEPPDYLPRACLIEPLSCVIHACHIADVKEGMKVLICGGGGIGMLFCFLLQRVFNNIEVTLAEINSQKMNLIQKYFHIKPYYCQNEYNYDLVIDCSNSISGLKFALDNTYRGKQICIMSHLYGLETSFVYEQACKKELRCHFPLRNGQHNNLLEAAQYINLFWTYEDDEMLSIYDDISLAFKEKSFNPFCKQIVKCTALCMP